MRICKSVADLRSHLADAKRPLGFLPTMGALHEGHLSGFRLCREECATVVASIFVNPLQFGDGEDLDRYPRDLDRDAALLEAAGVDVLFAPDRAEIYPGGFSTSIEIGPLASLYEGAHRPGHFAGVCTVVCKLLNQAAPDRAYLGRKDAQQLAAVRRMVLDLDLDVEIRPVETVREEDGLALSSRNAYLSAEDRGKAPGLAAGLIRGRDLWSGGERDLDGILRVARDPDLVYDYLACVHPGHFGPPAAGGPALLIAAVRMGGTRLIDNILLEARI